MKPIKVALILFTILLSLAFSQPLNVFSIREGDELTYSFEIRSKLSWQGAYVDVTLTGTLDLEVKEIRTNEMVVEVTVRGDVSRIDSNLPSREVEELRRNLRSSMNIKETITIPLGKMISTTGSPLFNIFDTTMPTEVDLERADLKVLEVKKDKRLGRTALYEKAKLDLAAEYYGIRQTVKAYVEGYVDLATGLIIECKVNMELSISGYQDVYGIVELSFKLENRDLLERAKTSEYKIKFKDGEGRAFISAEDLSLEKIRSERNKLIFRAKGSGMGVIVVELPKEVEVEAVYVDGSKAGFAVVDGDDVRYVHVPLVFSTREVEIQFDQDIVGLSKAIDKSVLLVSVAVLAVVIATVAVTIAVLRKKVKKTTTLGEQPEVKPDVSPQQPL